jgi:hypothetical protein
VEDEASTSDEELPAEAAIGRPGIINATASNIAGNIAGNLFFVNIILIFPH